MSAGERRRKKQNGVHYTPPQLAGHVAREIANNYSFDRKSLQILDPAVGGGELLSAILAECSPFCRYTTATGFDTDKAALDISSERLRSQYPEVKLNLVHQDFLDTIDPPKGRNLFQEASTAGVLADIIIANPPYVRTQTLGAGRAQELADKFQLDGRVDLYQAFLKAISLRLRPGGIAGIITSNRFMSIKSGSATRAGILKDFDILHIWDMGDTRIFEAAVLPAILLLRRKESSTICARSGFTSVYRVETAVSGDTVLVSDTCAALRHEGLVRTLNGDVLRVQQGHLERGHSDESAWRLSTATSDRWLATVDSNTYCTFGDIGKVRVGVKTTADSIFMQPCWSEAQDSSLPELLLPVTTHHVARRYRSLPVTRKILYPHIYKHGARTAVNLEDFPISKAYLDKHKPALLKRKYLVEGGRKWFEIWVPQDPRAWVNPKIVFRDIAEKPTFWMDLDGTVVNGDCYWITANAKDEDLLWLILAVANSRFIESFYDHKFNNKLYSGRRRFMTQYVESFPLPNPGLDISTQLVKLSKSLYRNPQSENSNYEEEVERLVCESFGVSDLVNEGKINFQAKESAASYSQHVPRSA